MPKEARQYGMEKTLNGAEVEPGIYLVFVSDDLGLETLVTKIMMMR